MKEKYLWLLILILCAALDLIAHPARATLGESADSIAADQKALAAGAPSTVVREKYTVQELRTAAVTLREYVSSEGVVFALAWNGLIQPDLKPLLGSYAGEYEAALAQTERTPGRRELRVQAARVVVETWGQMRDLRGRAYVPSLLPPGVTVDEIK